MLNRYRILKQFLFSFLFSISLILCLWIGDAPATEVQPEAGVPASIVSSVSPSQQVQQGIESYEKGEFEAAIEQWLVTLDFYQANQDGMRAAIVLENLARAYQALGQTEVAIHSWEQAATLYGQLQDFQQVGRMLTEQAQAYSREGQYRTALTLLCNPEMGQSCREDSALNIARDQGDQSGEAAALGSLGDVYRLRGDYTAAIDILQTGLAIARELDNPIYLSSVLNSLGNTYLSLAQLSYGRAIASDQIEASADATDLRTEALENDRMALTYLEESLQLTQSSNDALGQVRVLISAIPAYYRTSQSGVADTALEQAFSSWSQVIDSQEKVYLALNLAQFLQTPPVAETPFARWQCNRRTIDPQAKNLLNQAVAIAQIIGDPRSESFALGELGHLYECEQSYDQAMQLTRQAQIVADQNLRSKDSLYLWQWQAGRIFAAQGQVPEALRAYEAATATLKTIQTDIVVAKRDIRFDFRDTVEPIYRELIALYLTQEQPSILIPSMDSPNNIDQVLNTLDNLKLAELQNYFGNDCVLTALREGVINLAAIDSTNVAVFNTVILNDRSAVILSMRNEQQQLIQQFEWIKDEQGNYLDQKTLTAQINQYRQGLERFRDAIPTGKLGGYNPEQAMHLYHWLIQPFMPILNHQSIETLVFVQDGIFRSIPMAALYDGEKFLVEQYAIATTPSLNLTNLQPLVRQHLQVLALGITEQTTVEGRVFPELSYVNNELQSIRQILPASTELVNQDFTRDRLQQELEAADFPIIHIATHGQFSTEAENAFLVTGYDPQRHSQKLTINDLDDIIRNASTRPIELLVLSACQTAAGDDRAALGLAGIAAQAGAKSVLASLWSVNDQATAQLVTQFYQSLFDTNLSKAQALQAAQQALITAGGRTAHPAYWAAFLLIGNWL